MLFPFTIANDQKCSSFKKQHFICINYFRKNIQVLLQLMYIWNKGINNRRPCLVEGLIPNWSSEACTVKWLGYLLQVRFPFLKYLKQASTFMSQETSQKLSCLHFPSGLPESNPFCELNKKSWYPLRNPWCLPSSSDSNEHLSQLLSTRHQTRRLKLQHFWKYSIKSNIFSWWKVTMGTFGKLPLFETQNSSPWKLPIIYIIIKNFINN